MIAKVIPVQRRGLWSGLGHRMGALLGVGGAWFVGQILVRYGFPNNFSLLFLLATIFIAISWSSIALTREPPGTATKAKVPLGYYLRQLPSVLARDRNYRRFPISRTVVKLGSNGRQILYGLWGAAIHH